MNAYLDGPALTATELNLLNQRYRSLSISQRLHALYQDFAPTDIMVTSSFAATSAILLREVAQAQPRQKIYFIDTGNHFPETLSYKRLLTGRFALQVESLRASKKEQETTQREQTWRSDPDLCCAINKVAPLNKVKSRYGVWVSGLMAWQNPKRAQLNFFERKDGLLKFHPLLDMSAAEQGHYMAQHNLPYHPLVRHGYDSIGCTHCTRPGKNRSGRWGNSDKTECGLHW